MMHIQKKRYALTLAVALAGAAFFSTGVFVFSTGAFVGKTKYERQRSHVTGYLRSLVTQHLNTLIERGDTIEQRKWYGYTVFAFQRGVNILDSHPDPDFSATPFMASFVYSEIVKKKGLPPRALAVDWIEPNAEVIGFKLTASDGATFKYNGFDPSEWDNAEGDISLRHWEALFLIDQDSETVEQYPALKDADNHYIQIPSDVLKKLSEPSAFHVRLLRSDGTESNAINVFPQTDFSTKKEPEAEPEGK